MQVKEFGKVTKVALDFDSMLNDLIYPWVAWCRERFEAPGLKVTDVSHWDFFGDSFGSAAFEFICGDSYRQAIRPLPGAVEFVRKLERVFGLENVFVVTASPSEAEEAKLNNLLNFYDIPGDRVHQVPIGETKAPYTEGAVLIDDYGKNILEHAEANQNPGIIFNLNGTYGWSGLHHYCPERVRAVKDLVVECHGYDDILATLGLAA